MLAESWFKICHFLKVMNKPRSHFALKLWFSSQKVSHHFFFAYKTISVREIKSRVGLSLLMTLKNLGFFHCRKHAAHKAHPLKELQQSWKEKNTYSLCGSYLSLNSNTEPCYLTSSWYESTDQATKWGNLDLLLTQNEVMPLAGHQPSQSKRFWITTIIKPVWLGNGCYIYLLGYLLLPLCYMHSFPMCCTELFH